jgi:hypothetical protein
MRTIDLVGWCHEFGPQIHEGCNHPMVARADSCSCDRCGTVCRGRFNGCPAVWERGVSFAGPPTQLEPIILADVDFSLNTMPSLPTAIVTPIAPLVPPPLPPPVVKPVVAVVPPRRTMVLKAVSTPRPRITRNQTPPEGLAALRQRLDGLKAEVQSLGDSLGERRWEIEPEPRDWP